MIMAAMSAMTVSQVAHQLAKAENALRRARDQHGKPGRGGAICDMTDLIARNERHVDEWRRLLAFARGESTPS